MQEHHASASASAANVLCPNVLELGVMTRTEPRDPAQVLSAARQLLDRGPRLVLVKHLAHAGLDPERAFEMLLVARSAAWHVATPLLPFSRPPVGVGDLTSGLFLANLLHGKTPPEALEHTASAYFAVMQAPCVASYTITPSPACTRPGLDAACLPACPLTWSLSREPGVRGRRRVRAAARGGAGRPRRTQAVVRGQAAPRARAFVTGRYFGTRVDTL